jgi:hypothetical protein
MCLWGMGMETGRVEDTGCVWECEYCNGYDGSEVIGAEGSGGRVSIASTSVCARGRFWEIERPDTFPGAAVAISGGGGDKVGGKGRVVKAVGVVYRGRIKHNSKTLVPKHPAHLTWESSQRDNVTKHELAYPTR